MLGLIKLIFCLVFDLFRSRATLEAEILMLRQQKIKATIEGFGCTGGKIEKADFGYEVDDVKCKDGQEYEIKLDPNFKLIVMTRD